jgi:hypothetical protein
VVGPADLLLLLPVLALVALVGLVGDDPDVAGRRLVDSRCAVSSSCTPPARSSVALEARDTIEVTTIEAMKNDAIRMPSGRSSTLTTVV